MTICKVCNQIQEEIHINELNGQCDDCQERLDKKNMFGFYQLLINARKNQ